MGGLSSNPSDRAITLLAHEVVNNPDKINAECWLWLSINPSDRVVTLLKNNVDKINAQCWMRLFSNPSIFEYNYASMRKHCNIYKEDLMKNRFHPRNLDKFRDWGIDGF